MNKEYKVKVSIIIPVYNASKYLERLIESLINQSLKEIEFIFVNDGSNDNSLEILNKYSKIDNRIFVVNKINSGVSAARNSGLDIANGEFIGFVDSDDYVDVNMFEILYNKAQADNSDIVSCAYYIKSKDNQQIMFSVEEKSVFVEEAISYLLQNSKIGMSACNKLFRHEVIKNKRFEVGRRINEDRYFLFQAILNCKKVTLIPNALYYYWVNNESASKSQFDLRWMDALYFSEKMYRECVNIYPQLEHIAYTDIIKQIFFILVRMISDSKENIFFEQYKYLIKRVKGVSFYKIKGNMSKSIYIQLIMIKYCNKVYCLLKRAWIKRSLNYEN